LPQANGDQRGKEEKDREAAAAKEMAAALHE